MQSDSGKLRNRLLILILTEEGQDLIEYGLIALLLSTGVVAALGSISSHLVDAFNYAVSQFP